MKQFSEELLLHFFLMMIIPLASTLLIGKAEKVFRLSLFGILILTTFLTMSFPVEISDGLSFDLKFIPVFVTFLYLGPKPGVFSIAAIVLFESVNSPNTILISLLNYLIISIPLFILTRKYHQYKITKKIGIASLFYILISFSRLILLIATGKLDASFYVLMFTIISFAALCAIIYFIELTRLQVYMLEQLQNAEKMNAISQLAASVAHEIRNPMTTIRGFMQIMRDEKNLTSEQTMYVSLSLDELDRTHNIINDFLSLARPSGSDFEVLNASSLLKETVEFMRPYSTIANVDIQSYIQEGANIEGSPTEFKQLIINLMKNGIEAMPEGGELIIICQSQNGFVSIIIEDKGIGLSTKQLNQLGLPYYSTKTKGTGLGLMISFNILKRMKGKVQINSEIKKGTKFTLVFKETVS